MAVHSSVLAWKIPWTEESGGLQSKGLQRAGHNWVIEYTHAHTHTHTHTYYQLCESNLFISLRLWVLNCKRRPLLSLPKRGARGWNEMELVKCLVRIGWVAPIAVSNITIPRSIVLSCFSRVRLFVTPWTVACQAPRPWDFQGKNTGVGCHFLPNPGIEPASSTLAGRFFTTTPPGKPPRSIKFLKYLWDVLMYYIHRNRLLFNSFLFKCIT